MIQDLLEKALAYTVELWGTPGPGMQGPEVSLPTPFERGVPTMQPGVYRPVSPMLQERFDLWGRSSPE